MVGLKGGKIEEIELGELGENGVFLRSGNKEGHLAVGLFLELFKHLFGSFDGFGGKASEFGDVDAVALVCAAADDLAEEDDARGDLLDGRLEVGGVGIFGFEFGEFPIVGREEGFCLFAMGGQEVFGNGPGDGDAVVGAGATTNFVEEDEGTGCGVVEDVGRFGHFNHEGRLATREIIAGADAGEDFVDEADAR